MDKLEAYRPVYLENQDVEHQNLIHHNVKVTKYPRNAYAIIDGDSLKVYQTKGGWTTTIAHIEH